jgi:transcriptional regulator
MYNPDQFREERPEILRAFIAAHPLGVLIALTADGLTANHIPMIWQPHGTTPGLLQGHVARGNSLARSVPPDAPVLVVFGGADHYLTPAWYPAKQEHGKVVPTWNYSVVQARGTIRFIDDRERARRNVTELTNHQESQRQQPWAVTDAPADYIDTMLGSIVPFEIALTQLVGKFKASQHRAENERQAVRAALTAENVPAADRDELIRSPR